MYVLCVIAHGKKEKSCFRNSDPLVTTFSSAAKRKIDTPIATGNNNDTKEAKKKLL